jgi:hypothetical protein
MTAPPPPNDDSDLLHWLANRDVPCPLCNYNLRSLTTPRCPECGNDLRLSVALSEPYIKPWITLAIAICGSAGAGIIFSFIVLRAGLSDGFGIDGPIIYYMITIPTPIILLLTRRRYQRLPRRTQWSISLFAAALTLLATGILCASIN